MAKLKTYQCIEHNEIFYIDAKNRQEAEEAASMYGGSVMWQRLAFKETKNSVLTTIDELNQYLLGNVTKASLQTTLLKLSLELSE